MEQDNRIPLPKQILRRVLDSLINAKLSSRQTAALIQCSDSPATMGEIARACGFSTAAATGMVDTLEKRGLVLRGTFLGGQKGQADNLYHYSIQSIADFAAWMAFPKWISGSYMVHVGKQLLANRGFSRILGPTSQVLARYYRGIRRVKRLRRRRTNQKKSGP